MRESANPINFAFLTLVILKGDGPPRAYPAPQEWVIEARGHDAKHGDGFTVKMKALVLALHALPTELRALAREDGGRGSLTAQRDHRVNLRRSTGRDIAGQQGDQRQQQ